MSPEKRSKSQSPGYVFDGTQPLPSFVPSSPSPLRNSPRSKESQEKRKIQEISLRSSLLMPQKNKLQAQYNESSPLGTVTSPRRVRSQLPTVERREAPKQPLSSSDMLSPYREQSFPPTAAPSKLTSPIATTVTRPSSGTGSGSPNPSAPPSARIGPPIPPPKLSTPLTSVKSRPTDSITSNPQAHPQELTPAKLSTPLTSVKSRPTDSLTSNPQAHSKELTPVKLGTPLTSMKLRPTNSITSNPKPLSIRSNEEALTPESSTLHSSPLVNHTGSFASNHPVPPSVKRDIDAPIPNVGSPLGPTSPRHPGFIASMNSVPMSVKDSRESPAPMSVTLHSSAASSHTGSVISNHSVPTSVRSGKEHHTSKAGSSLTSVKSKPSSSTISNHSLLPSPRKQTMVPATYQTNSKSAASNSVASVNHSVNSSSPYSSRKIQPGSPTAGSSAYEAPALIRSRCGSPVRESHWDFSDLRGTLNGFIPRRRTFGTSKEATEDLIRLCKRRVFHAESFRTLAEEGGDLMATSPDLDRPVLHLLAAEGQAACVVSCMYSPNPIDFRKVDKINACTVLHLASQVNEAESAVTMLEAIVVRLSCCPQDKVDWGQENSRGRSFISWVALFQDLLTVWYVIKDVPYFSSSCATITSKPYQSNWNRLGRFQRHFILANGTQPDHETIKLDKVCKELWPNPEVVRRFVERGGDVCYTGPGRERPIIHQFIKDQHFGCVAECWKTNGAIDFITRDTTGHNLLHYVTGIPKIDDAKAVLTQMVERYNEHELDMLKWVDPHDSEDFISAAVKNQRLGLLFPLVMKARKFPLDRGPIRINQPISRYDWETLGELQQYFNFPAKGYLDDTLAMAQLCTQSYPNPEEVKVYINEGADLGYKGPGMIMPTLHYVISNGWVDCVRVCTQAPRRINFLLQDDVGFTPPLCVFRCPTVDDAARIVELLVDRIKSHPLDRVEWEQTDLVGCDFLTWAERCKKSFPVYQLTKFTPYFRAMKKEMRRNALQLEQEIVESEAAERRKRPYLPLLDKRWLS